ncbi:hypothetical protein QQS21_008279 [Conoideocrella luteorostrata]|uniref:NADP-dependent oxidoreductase domain-containing protein n=1 Tax=Conoideocrella luteorostrata TaxID=1105319 RepID=A0AAJ0CK13_9HYPO|nr:hypothetical protein QQS21_008279 [Conoideocrella luteorostrata]
MTHERLVLNTGAEIPALGLGTWQSKPGQVANAVLHALRSGYRHIDAAYCYGNEVEEGLDRSLQNLGLDYVNLYLVHWPVALNPNGNDDKFPSLPSVKRDLYLQRSHTETWKDMEAVFAARKAKAIGVANYSLSYLKELLTTAKIMPAVNQMENHPLLP